MRHLRLTRRGGDGGGEDVSPELVREALGRDRELIAAFDRAWPLLGAADLVGDLWSVPV